MVARVRGWLVAHPVEVVFALLVVGTFGYSLRITGGSYFEADHWPMFAQAGSVGGIVEPYNGHLSVIVLALYRVLIDLFGFVHLPFQVVGTLSLLGVSVAYVATTRRRLGAPLAAFLGLPLLLPAGMDLYSAALNHYLAAIGAVLCAAALDRGPRADGALAAALVFSLLSAGGGVAVAGACLVHGACVRPPLRRWLAVAVPTALWGLWYLAVGARADEQPVDATVDQIVAFARDLVVGVFENLALGSRPLAVVLLVAFVGFGLWRLRAGLDAAANVVGWSAGLVVWAVALGFSRAGLGEEGAFRYEFVGLVFVLLAVVPRRPIHWPERFPLVADRRWVAVAACLLLVAGAARGLAVRSDLQDSARRGANVGRLVRGETLVLGLGPGVVDDATTLPFRFGVLSAGEVRTLLDRYGQPFPATPATADQRLVDLQAVRAVPVGRAAEPQCRPLTVPFVQDLDRPRTYLGSDQGWTVEVQRFGQDWVEVGRGQPGQVLLVALPELNSDIPWLVRADGACRVLPPSPPGGGP